MGIEETREREQRWQQAWRDARIFEAAPKPGAPKFFITIPYPYISGSLHIGHARVVTEADVYARFQRMRGLNTLYPIAFHISGTPVLGISLAIKNGDQKKIDLYKGYVRAYIEDEAEVERIVKTFEDPEAIVEFFIPKMKDEFATLGLSVDWRRSYTSGDFDHQALVEWQFRKYQQQGYLKQGSYPILYSTTLSNAVGEDDIIDGDSNPVEVQEFTLIKFRYGGAHSDEYLIAATLRPETMYGQTNMWANPELTYVRAKVNGEQWIVSRECAEKLKHQEKAIDIVGEVPGRSLMGKTCFAPFVEREIPILPSAHCDADIGTGLVTSVPSDAPFDYIALKELQDSPQLCAENGIDHAMVKSIELIPIITSKGYGDFPAVEICKRLGITALTQHDKLAEATQEIYKLGFHTGVMKETCGPFAGMSVQQAKDGMRKRLLEEKKADTFYETSRKAKSRDGGKVIVAVLDGQWFLDFNAPGWKEKAGKLLEGMELWPEKYRTQFEDVFAWLDKRPCARKRGLGTRLPFAKDWVIESLSDSTIYMALYPIAHTIRRERLKKEQLTDAFFEFVMNRAGDARTVAASTGITAEALIEMQQEWQYWYPFDQRHTFVNHLSNHLSFMIFAHTATFSQQHWPRRISFHGLVMSEGDKMSKSKGNVVTLLDVRERYGADSFRALMCNSTSVESTFNWQADTVEQMRRHLEGLGELLSAIQAKKEEGDVKDAAFVSRTERSIRKATEALARMDLREYSSVVLFEMLTNYKRATRFAAEDELSRINAYIGNRWTAMLTPLVPHLAEELWRKDASNGGFVSAAPWPSAEEERIDDRAEADQEYIEEIVANIRKNLQLKKLDAPGSITLFRAEGWKYAFVTEFRKTFQEMKDPKAIAERIAATVSSAPREEILKLTFAVVKNMKLLPLADRTPSEEQLLLEQAVAVLDEEFKCPTSIGDPASSEEPKSKNGLPGKPAIVLG